VQLLLRQGEFPSLVPLISDPGYAPFFSPAARLKVAFYQRDWPLAAKRLLEMEFATMRALPLLMALAAAIAWLFVAIHVCQPHRWFSFRTIAPCIAVVLGFIGALGAHFVGAWQEEVLGMRESGEFLPDLGFYIGLVVPREILIKLLLIIPFVPRLLARKSPLDTLVVTGCVGLGFAIEGNLQLCKQANLGDSLGRLLTANFFHFAASALLGLAFCRWLARERGAAVSAMVTLVVIILTQGIYDAFTKIPAAQPFIVVAVVAFLILSRVVFAELRRWRDSFTDQCFLGATLVLSLGALVSTLLVAASMQFGLDRASWALLRNSPILLMVVVVFFGQFKRGFAPIGSDLVSPAQTV
jgi:RsiW-degrading membrane proteinase PrsW (M82 family)